MASKRLQSFLEDFAGLEEFAALEDLARSGVVFMVSATFMWLGSACRDDANGAVAQRVGHVDYAAVDHAQNAVTVLAVVLAVVEALNGEGVLENFFRCIEANAMVGIVLRGLVVVPFERVVVHNTTD